MSNESKVHFENSWMVEYGMLRDVVSYLQSVLVEAYKDSGQNNNILFDAIGITEPEQLPTNHRVHRTLRLLEEGKEPKLTRGFDDGFGGD
jgi:hypothetical protein